MIARKKKLCKECGKMEYLWSGGRCKPCHFSISPTKIPKVSKTKKRENTLYLKERLVYLNEHPVCEVCKTRSATEVHHKKGRGKNKTTNPDTFLAVCRPCHTYIELHPTWAKENGYSNNRTSEE